MDKIKYITLTISEAKKMFEKLNKVLCGRDTYVSKKECLDIVHKYLTKNGILEKGQQVTVFSLHRFVMELQKNIRGIPEDGIVYQQNFMTAPTGLFSKAKSTQKMVMHTIELTIVNSKYASINVNVSETVNFNPSLLYGAV